MSEPWQDGWLRIYGQSGVGSFAELTNGIAEAAAKEGVLAGVVHCNEQAPDSRTPIGYLQYLREHAAPVALVLGSPSNLYLAHSRGGHQKHWFMLAPNACGLPPHFVRAMKEAAPGKKQPLFDGLVAPSHWAAGVLRACFDQDVVVMPHGVRQDYRPDDDVAQTTLEAYRDGKFYVLHITSSDRQRKGTRELLQAWKQLCDGGHWTGAQLFIMCHPLFLNQHKRMLEEEGVDQSVVLLQGLGLSTEEMRAAYCSAHVVCQPSRAEGFGIVPLEARCCGTPIIATRCTGHSEHVRVQGNDLVVAHGPDAPIDDYPGARAPTVNPQSIVGALGYARTSWEELRARVRAESDELRELWSWPAASRDGLLKLRQLSGIP